MAESSLPKTYKAIVTNRDGKLPTIEEQTLTQPGKNQVVVKIEYAAINHADIGIIDGWYPVKEDKPIVGYEASGIIAAVGSDLSIPHKVGDKVHVATQGTWREYALVNSEECQPIIDNVSMEEASSHIVNPGVVVQMAHVTTKGGHKCAIHTTGTSAVGKMMIAYFKKRGIKLINIVRKPEKVDELMKEGADIVLDSSQSDFEAKLKDVSQKEEATIAFDAIASDFSGKVLNAMPKGSTIQIYGVLGNGKIGDLNPGNFIFQKKIVEGLWMSEFLQTLKPEELKEFFKEVHSNLSGPLKSKIQKAFSLEQFKEAIDLHREKSSAGKILFKP